MSPRHNLGFRSGGQQAPPPGLTPEQLMEYYRQLMGLSEAAGLPTHRAQMPWDPVTSVQSQEELSFGRTRRRVDAVPNPRLRQEGESRVDHFQRQKGYEEAQRLGQETPLGYGRPEPQTEAELTQAFADAYQRPGTRPLDMYGQEKNVPAEFDVPGHQFRGAGEAAMAFGGEWAARLTRTAGRILPGAPGEGFFGPVSGPLVEAGDRLREYERGRMEASEDKFVSALGVQLDKPNAPGILPHQWGMQTMQNLARFGLEGGIYIGAGGPIKSIAAKGAAAFGGTRLGTAIAAVWAARAAPKVAAATAGAASIAPRTTAATRGALSFLKAPAGDVAAFLPLDILTTQYKEDSTAAVVDMFLDPEIRDQWADDPEGFYSRWINDEADDGKVVWARKAATRVGMNALHVMAEKAMESEVGRAAFEASFGFAADIALRGGFAAIMGTGRGARAFGQLSMDPAAVDPVLAGTFDPEAARIVLDDAALSARIDQELGVPTAAQRAAEQVRRPPEVRELAPRGEGQLRGETAPRTGRLTTEGGLPLVEPGVPRDPATGLVRDPDTGALLLGTRQPGSRLEGPTIGREVRFDPETGLRLDERTGAPLVAEPGRALEGPTLEGPTTAEVRLDPASGLPLDERTGLPLIGSSDLLGGRTAITQEAVSSGRHGFGKFVGDLDEVTRTRFTEDIRAALTDEDGRDVTVRFVNDLVPEAGEIDVDVTFGHGFYEGGYNPNEIVTIRTQFTDPDIEERVLQAYMAVNGIVRGQDAQAAMSLRVVGASEKDATRGWVIGRHADGKLEALEPAELERVARELAEQGFDSTVHDSNGTVFVIDFDKKGEALDQAVRGLTGEEIAAQPRAFDTHWMEGTRAYLETLEGSGRAVQGLADILTERIAPVYQRHAAAAGLGDDAFSGLTARTEELTALRGQLDSPLTTSARGGRTIPETARTLSKRFRRLTTTSEPAITRTLASRMRSVIDEFVEGADIDPAVARDWYGGGVDESRKIAQLSLPELRNDADFELFTIASSILSNGQKVVDELPAAIGVMDQFYRTGRFSLLDPEKAQRFTFGMETGTQGRLRGQRAFRGPRAEGTPTLAGPRETVGGSRQGVTQEVGLKTLNDMIDDLGVEGAARFLKTTVERRKGGVLTDVPVLEDIFGEKVGRYAGDKLGLPDFGQGTVDMWGARGYHFLMGTAKITDAGKIDDNVPTLMRDRLNAAFARVAKAEGTDIKTVQAKFWYGVKWAYRNAGAREKTGAMATLPSATAEGLLRPGRLAVPDPETGLMPELSMGIPRVDYATVDVDWDPTVSWQTMKRRPEYQEALAEAQRFVGTKKVRPPTTVEEIDKSLKETGRAALLDDPGGDYQNPRIAWVEKTDDPNVFHYYDSNVSGFGRRMFDKEEAGLVTDVTMDRMAGLLDDLTKTRADIPEPTLRANSFIEADEEFLAAAQKATLTQPSGAMDADVQGMFVGQPSKMDELVTAAAEGKPSAVRELAELRAAFEPVRQLLRKDFGERVTLYRFTDPKVEAGYKDKATQLFTSAKYAEEFADVGRRADAYEVNVDDIIAVPGKGGYHEFIVDVSRPGAAKLRTERAARVAGQDPRFDEFANKAALRLRKEGIREYPAGGTRAVYHGVAPRHAARIEASGEIRSHLLGGQKTRGGTTDEVGLIWVSTTEEMAEGWSVRELGPGTTEGATVVGMKVPDNLRLMDQNDRLTADQAARLMEMSPRTHEPIVGGYTLRRAFGHFAQIDSRGEGLVQRDILKALELDGYTTDGGANIALAVDRIPVDPEADTRQFRWATRERRIAEGRGRAPDAEEGGTTLGLGLGGASRAQLAGAARVGGKAAVGGLVGGLLDASVGEDSPIEGMYTGMALAVAPSLVRGLKNLRVRAVVADDAIDSALQQQLAIEQVAREAPEMMEGVSTATPPPEGVPPRTEWKVEGRKLTPIDPEEFVNIKKFGLEPGSTEERLKEAVLDVVDQTGMDPKEVVTHEQTIRIAESLGLEAQDLARRLGGAGGAPAGAEMLAARNIITANVRRIDELFQHLKANNIHIDSDEAAPYVAQINTLQGETNALLARYMPASSATGRALNAMKIAAQDSMDPATWVIRAARVSGVTELPPSIAAEITRLTNAKDKQGLMKLLANLQKSDISEQIVTLGKAAMLSAVPTHAMNLLSTAYNVFGVEHIKDLPASWFDFALSAWAGTERTKHWGSVAAQLEAAKKGAQQGLESAKDVLHGRLPEGSLERWDQIRQVNVDLAQRTPLLKSVPVLPKIIDSALDAGQKTVFGALGAGDALLTGFAVQRSLAEMAQVIALNEGLKGAELYARAAVILAEETTPEMMLEAVAQGMLATFRNKGIVGAFVTGGKRGLRDVAKKGGGLVGLGNPAHTATYMATEALIPWSMTPANVVTRVAEASPLGAASVLADSYFWKLVTRRVTTESPETQKRIVETLGRSTVGAAPILLGIYLYNEGLLSLGWRQEKAGQREITGEEENAWLMGDDWISMERMSPGGNLAILGGHIAHEWAKARRDADTGVAADIGTTALGATLSIGKTAYEQSFLEGINKLGTFFQGAEKETGRKNIFAGTAGMFVPNILKRLNRWADPTMRVRETVGDELMQAVPGLARLTGQPARVDPFGETRKYREGFYATMIDPLQTARDKTIDNPVRALMRDLDISISRRQKMDEETAQMYEQRQRMEGKALEAAIGSLMGSSEFRALGRQVESQLPPGTDAKTLELVTKAVQAEAVEALITSERTKYTRSYRAALARRQLTGAGR